MEKMNQQQKMQENAARQEQEESQRITGRQKKKVSHFARNAALIAGKRSYDGRFCHWITLLFGTSLS